MHPRTQAIAEVFTRFLMRYVTPTHLRNLPEARQEEAESLLKALLKSAPLTDYVEWVADVLDRLEYQMKTRAWPTKAEIGAVCRDKAKESRPVGFIDRSMSIMCPYEIEARRMKRGESVDERYIYGPRAWELLCRGLVTEEEMESYRYGAFCVQKKVYGEEAAKKWKSDAVARHEEARPEPVQHSLAAE